MRVARLCLATVVVACCAVGCARATSPEATQLPRTDRPLSSTSLGPSAGTTATRTPSAAAPVETSSTLSRHYLGLARNAFAGRTDAQLVDLAFDICRQVEGNGSAHDAVGDLAAQLGQQSQAQELVDAATSAYCPAAPPR